MKINYDPEQELHYEIWDGDRGWKYTWFIFQDDVVRDEQGKPRVLEVIHWGYASTKMGAKWDVNKRIRKLEKETIPPRIIDQG